MISVVGQLNKFLLHFFYKGGTLWMASAKVKQKVIINNQTYGVGSIGMRDSVFKELPSNVKQGNKLTTMSNFRKYIINGQFNGEFSIGNKVGYLFKYQEYNVLLIKM
jgi:hypothetical protein